MAPAKVLNVKTNTAISEEDKSIKLISPWKDNPMSVENFYTLGESYVESLDEEDKVEEKIEDTVDINEENKSKNKSEDKYTKILKNLK